MKLFKIIAFVECDTAAQADTVMCERLGYDETYDDPDTGKPFDYQFTSYVVTPGDGGPFDTDRGRHEAEAEAEAEWVALHGDEGP